METVGQYKRLSDNSALLKQRAWHANSRPFLNGGQGKTPSCDTSNLHHRILLEPKKHPVPDTPEIMLHAPQENHIVTNFIPCAAIPLDPNHGGEGTDAPADVPAYQHCLHSNPVAEFDGDEDDPSNPSTCTDLSQHLLGDDVSHKPSAVAVATAARTSHVHGQYSWTNPFSAPNTTSLQPPCLTAGTSAMGYTPPQLRLENKRQRKQRHQSDLRVWKCHWGLARLPVRSTSQPHHCNSMCPTGVALLHPAAPLLLEYATKGCPVDTRTPWTKQQVVAAIRCGPHVSALAPDAMLQFDAEIAEKVAAGQARLVSWVSLQSCLPPQLKISPIAMVPHKSRAYRAILDLSFNVRLPNGTSGLSVNATTVKTAPKGSVDQLGHALNRLIHAFATTPLEDPIYMAKWDIKDGFWRLDCKEGQEWNFAYVQPSSHLATPTNPTLVIPTSLQMGWIESPAYFCVASETARDVATVYIDTPVGSLLPHKFCGYTFHTHACT